MGRDIFGAVEEQKQVRVSKTVSTRPTELGQIMCHNSAGIAVSNDPTKNKIKPADLMQRKTLGGVAKVYGARRNESAVTF